MRYQEFYIPTNYYVRAGKLAETFCKRNPAADKDVVYFAAQRAADYYERSGNLRKFKFKNIVHFFIRNALYIQKRRKAEVNSDER